MDKHVTLENANMLVFDVLDQAGIPYTNKKMATITFTELKVPSKWVDAASELENVKFVIPITDTALAVKHVEDQDRVQTTIEVLGKPSRYETAEAKDKPDELPPRLGHSVIQEYPK